MHQTGRDNQQGFTLGEILAVLAVAGIGLALAVPGLQALGHDNSRAAAVNQLVGSLHLARSEAITRNRPVALCASSTGTGCNSHDWSDGWIVFVDEDGDQQRSPSEALLAHAPPPGLLLGSAEFAGALSYTADGRPQGSGAATGSGSFVFCAAGAELAARVVLLPGNGLPVLLDPGHEAALPPCPGDPQR